MKDRTRFYLKATIIGRLLSDISKNRFNRKLLRRFPDNDIYSNNSFPLEILDIGKGSYGELNIITFNNASKLKIGSYVSIAQSVRFILDAEHSIDTFSTYPFRTKVMNNGRNSAHSKGNIIVDDDVWIGYGAIILSGVHIGKGAVIAAGALVARDVEPYTVVGGVPAKFIKKRFDDEIISVISKISFESIDKEFVESHIDEIEKVIESSQDLGWISDFGVDKPV